MMLYDVQFFFTVIRLVYFKVLVCLVKDLSSHFSVFDCMHTYRIVFI